MRLLVLLLVLAISLSAVSATTTDTILVSPARLTPVPKAFGSDFYDKYRSGFESFQTRFLEVNQPIGSLDGYKLKDYQGTPFFNSIFLADATGAPKYEFEEHENIYLKDARIKISSAEFSPVVEYISYRNMYRPNDPVDVYIMLDFSFYSDELPKFKFLISADVESRTRGQFILKKVTIIADDDGRLPFTNLGSMDSIIDLDKITSPGRKREGLQESALYRKNKGRIGSKGTYNYAKVAGSMFADNPFLTNFGFDLFIDSSQNGRWDAYGDHYYQQSEGLKKESSDVYLTPEVPGFIVTRSTPQLRGCCVCSKTQKSLSSVNDIYECNQFCEQKGENTAKWHVGICKDETKEVTLLKETKIEKFFLSSYTGVKQYFLVPYSKTSPSKNIGVAYTTTTNPNQRFLARSDDRLINIPADFISFNEERMELLLARDKGEIYIYKIHEKKKEFFAQELEYVNRVWDPLMLETGSKPFQGEITSARLQNNGNVVLKDSTGQKYTVVFNSIELETPVTIPQTQLKFNIADFSKDYEQLDLDKGKVRITRVAYESEEGLLPLKQVGGGFFEFTPVQIDYDPSRNLLAVLSNVDFIYIIKPVEKSDGGIAGEIMQIVERVQDPKISLIGEGTFLGMPRGIRLNEDGNLVVKDEDFKSFLIEIESDSPYQEIKDVLVVEGDYKEKAEEVIEEEFVIEEVFEEKVVEEVKGLDETTIIIVSSVLILLLFLFAALLIKRQRM